MKPSNGAWRAWMTDLLFLCALSVALAANLLLPALVLMLRVPGVLPGSLLTSPSHGLTLVLPYVERAGQVAAVVAGLALVTFFVYLRKRRQGLAEANLFVAWTWLVGAGLAPGSWALMLLGGSP